MSGLQKNFAAVRLSAKAMRAASVILSLPGKLMPPAFRLVQIGSAFWQSRALHAATHFDYATIIGDETLPADEIARRAGTQPDPTARLLRMLVALGVFEEPSCRHFRNNAASALLRRDRRNVRAMILMHNSAQMSRPWYEQLERGLATGTPPFELAHGADLYAYMDTDPELDTLFSEAMDTVELLSGDSFASDFDWRAFDRIVDIGGSKGMKAAAVLERHPHMTALIVDRASVIEDAQRYWRSKQNAAVFRRLRFCSGDALHAVPPAKSARDVYFLSGVFHGFDDESCGQALRNLAAACAPVGARIVLLELVLDEVRPALAEVLADMQMYMGTRGRERTLREWTGLFDRGEVALQEIVSLRSFGKMLVLRPKGASNPI